MSVDWTPERIELLTQLWNEGIATSEIGRRLDVTKNAVVGKVHRLGLPKRQSPIQRKPAKKEKSTGARSGDAGQVASGYVCLANRRSGDARVSFLW